MEQFLPCEQVIFSAKSDIDKEFDYSLPEYLPGISRIVKTSCRIEKCAPSENGRVDNIGVSVLFCVIYISDFGGKIRTAVFRETFSVPFPSAPETTSCTVLPSCAVSLCFSKPTSPRSLRTHLSLTSELCIAENKSKKIYGKDESDSLHVLTKDVTACDKRSFCGKEGSFSADGVIDSSLPAIGELILCDAVFCKAEARCGDGIADFEAHFLLHALYQASSEDGETIYLGASFPHVEKGRIYDDGITEASLCHLRFDTTGCEGAVSFDSFGENRVIGFEVKYSASGFSHCSYEKEVALDGFSDSFGYDIKSVPTTFTRAVSPINTVFTATEKLRADTGSLSNICTCVARITSVSYESSAGRFFAAAKCLVEVSGTDGSGMLCSSDGSCTLHIPLGTASTNLSPDAVISISSCRCEVREGGLVCDFEMRTDGFMFEKITENVVESLSENTEKPISKDTGKVTVYYPASGEEIWSISKKYKVNPDYLRRVNSLDDSPAVSKKTLLIP